MAEAIEFAAVILSRTLSPTRGLAHPSSPSVGGCIAVAMEISAVILLFVFKSKGSLANCPGTTAFDLVQI